MAKTKRGDGGAPSPSSPPTSPESVNGSGDGGNGDSSAGNPRPRKSTNRNEDAAAQPPPATAATKAAAAATMAAAAGILARGGFPLPSNPLRRWLAAAPGAGGVPTMAGASDRPAGGVLAGAGEEAA